MPVQRGDVPPVPTWHEYPGLDIEPKIRQYALDMGVYLENHLGAHTTEIRQIETVQVTLEYLADLTPAGILYIDADGGITEDASNFSYDDSALDLTVDTLTLGGGSITDTSGAIAFGNEALSGTGTLSFGAITGTSFVIGGSTLDTTEWTYLDGQDQSVRVSSGVAHASLLLESAARPTLRILDTGNPTIRLFPAIAGLRMDLSVNAYYTGAQWLRDINEQAALMAVEDTGDIKFFVAAADVIANPISWTEVFAIKNDGACEASGAFVAGATTLDSLTFDMTMDYAFSDFSGVLALQSQTSAQPSRFYLFSKDGDVTDDVNISIFARGTPSQTTDLDYLYLGFRQAGPYFWLYAAEANAGVLYPIYMGTGVNVDQLVLGTDGNNTMSGDLACANLTATTNITCANLVHIGDANTRIVFGTDFYYLEAGGLEMARFAGSGKNPASTFNIDQGDINFLVSTSGDVNALWVDGGTDKVGIGDAAPGEKLDVAGNINLTGVLKIDDVQIVKEQQAHIADATTQDIAGADTVDETKLESDLTGIVGTINSILSTLEAHGIVASA